MVKIVYLGAIMRLTIMNERITLDKVISIKNMHTTLKIEIKNVASTKVTKKLKNRLIFLNAYFSKGFITTLLFSIALISVGAMVFV